MHKFSIHVDARMLFHSGIGSYLQNILKRLSSDKSWNFILHGPLAKVSEFVETHDLSHSVQSCELDPYTIKSMLFPFGSPQGIQNLWVPHYNAPLFGVNNLVTTIHDVLHLRRDIVARKFAQYIYAKTCLSNACQKSKHILFNSNFTKSEFVRHVGMPRNFTVTLLGLDEAWIKLGENPPSRPPIPNPYILFVGSQMRHKGLGDLLEAFLGIPESSRPDLVIIGARSGLKNPDLHPILVSPNQTSGIHLLGKVDQGELEKWVSHANGLVFPSLYEGFGLPPIEALATGTPVLASDIPVLREVLDNKATFFQPGNIDSLKEGILRLTNSQRVQYDLSNFSWDKTTELHELAFAQAFQ